MIDGRDLGTYSLVFVLFMVTLLALVLLALWQAGALS